MNVRCARVWNGRAAGGGGAVEDTACVGDVGNVARGWRGWCGARWLPRPMPSGIAEAVRQQALAAEERARPAEAREK